MVPPAWCLLFPDVGCRSMHACTGWGTQPPRLSIARKGASALQDMDEFQRLLWKIPVGGLWAGLGGEHLVGLTHQWGRGLPSSPEVEVRNPPSLRQGFFRGAVTDLCPCLPPYPAPSQQLTEEDTWVPAPPPPLTLDTETPCQPSYP